jgi:hypothetical protein
MHMRLFAVTLAVCGACLLATPQSPAPAEPQQVEVIDFEALRAQATAAMETLQQSHERRLASVATTTF